jgi:hypothetical protein
MMYPASQFHCRGFLASSVTAVLLPWKLNPSCSTQYTMTRSKFHWLDEENKAEMML